MSNKNCPVLDAYKDVAAKALSFQKAIQAFFVHPDATCIFAIAQAHGYKANLPDINGVSQALVAAVQNAEQVEASVAAAADTAKDLECMCQGYPKSIDAEVVELPKQD